jgi:hypothetical protein
VTRNEDDLERRLSEWFISEGPDRAPERLRTNLDARLDQARQSHDRWPIHGRPNWRNKTAALAAVVAVVGLLLVLALLGPFVAGVRPVPTNLPTPSPTATTAPTANPISSPSPRGVRLSPGANVSTQLDPPLHFSVPAGWTKTADLPSQLLLVPPGAGLFEQPDHSLVFDNIGVYVHPLAGPADGGSVPLPGIGTDAKALSHWLSTRPQVTATTPTKVAIGGLSGYALDLGVSTAAGSLCGMRCVNLFNARDPGPAYQLGLFQNEEARAYMLDLPDGGVVLVLIEDADGSQVATLRAVAQGVLGSFIFNGLVSSP